MAFTAFDPNYSGSYLILSNVNRTIATSAPNDGTPYYQTVRVGEGKTAGKWCFRATLDGITHASSLFGSINIGICGYRLPNLTLGQLSPPLNYVGNQDFSVSQPARTGLAAASNGSGWFGNNIGDGFTGVGGTGVAWVDDDVIDFACDVDARLVWARSNGGDWNSDPTANPSTGVGGQPFEASSIGDTLTLGSRVWPAVSLGFFGDQVTVDFNPTALISDIPDYTGWTKTYDFLSNLLYATVGQTFNTPHLWVTDFTPGSDVSIAGLLVNCVSAMDAATQCVPVIYASDGTAGAPGTLIASGLVQTTDLAPPGFELAFSAGVSLTNGTKYYIGYISNATSQQCGARTATTAAYINGSGSPTPAAIPASFPTPTAATSNRGPAFELLIAPPAVLNMDNVVVTSLLTESPCTTAQFAAEFAIVGPALGLRWSDTRGKTFGNAVPQEFSTDPLWQPQWNRTGMARDRVFELFWTAALKTALNGAFVEVSPLKT